MEISGDGGEAVEGLKPKALRAPTSPTAEEIEEHEMIGHSVHRSWCGHCVRARGMLEKHPAMAHEEKALPTLGIDYYFFGKQDEGLPHLQVTDDCSGMSWSSAVPAKGADAFAVNFVVGILSECGYKRVTLRSDNEPAVKSLKEAVQAASSVEVLLEESKTGDSRSNGLAEAAVKESKRQCRAMKSAFLEKTKAEINDTHPIWSWVARHGNFLMSRYRVGQDGRTAYERLKGKRWKRPMVSFGEKVYFRPLKSYVAGQGDMGPQLKLGRYVGTHGRNGDVLIMTVDGVWKGGSIKRVPIEQRWDMEDFDKLRGTPWNLRPRMAEDVDSLPVRIALPEAEGRLTPEPALRDGGPRNLYVTKKDVEGQYTVGCPGCIAIQTGLPARSHNSECRTAVQQRLLQTEEGKLRVEKARKRKSEAVVPAEGGEHVALEDGPDVEQEVHGPDAVGRPAPERVEPLVQPAQAKRQAEGGEPKSILKKAKPEESRGVKRPVTDVKMSAEEKAVKVESNSSPSGGASSSSSKAAAEDISALLEANMFPGLESKKEILEIGQFLCSMGIRKSDVAEIYNPERFVSRANAFGLRPGFAIDLSLAKNDKGEYWDLSTEQDQKALRRLLRDEKPLVLIGSPPCGPFSPLQNLSKNKRSEAENQAILAEGRKHLKVATDAYMEQHQSGRFFLHEHPKPSQSWQEEDIKRIQELPGVYTVTAPMCKWHMKAEDGQGVGFVRKETNWMTNSKRLAEAIEGNCDGTHRHVHLINGRARHAQVYPPRLVNAILKGIRQELRDMGELSALNELVAGPCPDGASNEPTEEMWDYHDDSQEEIYDSVTGMQLDPQKVKKAREEELGWVEKQKIYEVADIQECWDATGAPPITLKWVDRDKGNSNYRSRLVVREIKRKGQALPDHDLYSAMPPLEALKVLCSLMVSKKRSARGGALKMRILDISRAHFYGASRRPVFTNLPPERKGREVCKTSQNHVRNTRRFERMAGNIHGVAQGAWSGSGRGMARVVLPRTHRFQVPMPRGRLRGSG